MRGALGVLHDQEGWTRAADTLDRGDIEVYACRYSTRIQIVDTRRPEQPYNRRRRLPGRVFALRSDGVFATVTEPRNGSQPIVNVWDRDGAHEVGRGNIPPGSLALGPNAVYWTADGAPQTAAATGPVR